MLIFNNQLSLANLLKSLSPNILVILSLLALPFSVNASIEKRAIIYVNGISTTKLDAKINKRVVESTFRQQANVDKVELAYNQKESALSDFAEVATQFLKQNENLSEKQAWAKFAIEYFNIKNNPVADYATTALADLNESNYVNDIDLTKLFNKVVALIEDGYKVVILPHSQGNFYANRVWDRIHQTIHNLELNKAVGIVGIATPANRVAGNGLYTTNSNDHVINAIRGYASAGRQPLPHNATHPFTSDDVTGHGLVDIYLSDKVAARNIKNKTIQNVNTMFNRLTSLESTTCEDFNRAIGGSWNGSYLPGNYNGSLDFSFSAYEATNSLRIFGSNGAILVNSNGYISGDYRGKFSYDSFNHGRLLIEILASQIREGWSLSIRCPQ